jgi:hypothetical protein
MPSQDIKPIYTRSMKVDVMVLVTARMKFSKSSPFIFFKDPRQIHRQWEIRTVIFAEYLLDIF